MLVKFVKGRHNSLLGTFPKLKNSSFIDGSQNTMNRRSISKVARIWTGLTEISRAICSTLPRAMKI
jgi:hypothetical protein